MYIFSIILFWKFWVCPHLSFACHVENNHFYTIKNDIHILLEIFEFESVDIEPVWYSYYRFYRGLDRIRLRFDNASIKLFKHKSLNRKL